MRERSQVCAGSESLRGCHAMRMAKGAMGTGSSKEPRPAISDPDPTRISGTTATRSVRPIMESAEVYCGVVTTTARRRSCSASAASTVDATPSFRRMSMCDACANRSTSTESCRKS
ncbi:hypothetical protein GCM10027091_64190 [Streptomyces daliensis]